MRLGEAHQDASFLCGTLSGRPESWEGTSPVSGLILLRR